MCIELDNQCQNFPLDTVLISIYQDPYKMTVTLAGLARNKSTRLDLDQLTIISSDS